MAQLNCRGFCEPDHSTSDQAAAPDRARCSPAIPHRRTLTEARSESACAHEIADRTIRAIEGWVDETRRCLPTTGLIQRARAALLRDLDQLPSAPASRRSFRTCAMAAAEVRKASEETRRKDADLIQEARALQGEASGRRDRSVRAESRRDAAFREAAGASRGRRAASQQRTQLSATSSSAPASARCTRQGFATKSRRAQTTQPSAAFQLDKTLRLGKGTFKIDCLENRNEAKFFEQIFLIVIHDRPLVDSQNAELIESR
jgi:hypothetical protein